MGINGCFRNVSKGLIYTFKVGGDNMVDLNVFDTTRQHESNVVLRMTEAERMVSTITSARDWVKDVS